MLICLYLQQNLTFRSALHTPRLPRFRHHPLALLSSFLLILTGVHARLRGPIFDTDTISNPTPCNPVTFSWTGGVSPFTLYITNDDTGNDVAEFDFIEDNFVTWTPVTGVIDKRLYAEVWDNDDEFDDTDDFVVQSASCSSSDPPAKPTSTVSSEHSTTTFPPTSSQTVYPVPPTESSTSPAKAPPPLTPPSTHLPQSTLGGPSSSSSPSLHGTSNTSTSQLGNSTTSSTPTMGTASATEGSTSPPFPTTSAMQSSASRLHRKSSVSAGEIAGIVLGAVALLCMLVALIVWRWAARRTAHDRTPEDDNYAALQSSLSTQHETSLSSTAAIRRHAYSVASPTTSAGFGAAASLLHGGGGVLHVYDRPLTANSVAVEPPTPPMTGHPPVLPPPPPTHAGEMKARGGGGSTTEVVATEPLPEVSPAGGTEAPRGGVQPRDQLGTTPEPPHDVDLDAKQEGGNGRGSGVGPGARFTLVESDGGVRLAGGPLPVGLLDDSEGSITRLPPPYHHYDS
ncbi:hypothetical protein LXA43DRAFT_366850 [Ganoderma leucocontextum]|nr:hypothetical protein LXA43DRAFT_366850 [Ganoderma leucocontextum]